MSSSKPWGRFLVVLSLLLVLPLCQARPALAIEVVPQTAAFYVNDAAGLLSPETEQYIIDINKKLKAASGAQVVVVTVPDMGGAALEDYTGCGSLSFGKITASLA